MNSLNLNGPDPMTSAAIVPLTSRMCLGATTNQPVARLAINPGLGRDSTKLTVWSSTTSIRSIADSSALRELTTPSGGSRTISKVCFTSAAVSGTPSWNLAFCTSVKV